MDWIKLFGGKDIAEFFIALYDRFGRPFGGKKPKAPNFVLAGPSGVGKTHISTSVAGDLVGLLSTPERTYETKEVSVENDQCRIVFFDTPGHKEGVTNRNQGLQAATQSGNYGILLVGAYGFHESKSMDPPPVKYGKATEDWIAEKRTQEVRVFGNILHRASILGLPRIVVTIVNKADLWLDDWDAVKRYYEESDYHEEITKMGVQHVVLKYCVVPKKFWELDKPALKLDLSEAQELHSNLVGLLSQYVER